MKQKITRNISFAIMLLLLFSTVLWTQPQSLTLDQAVEMAIQNNREVKIAKLELEKANSAVKEAFGYALPSLDVSANFSHFLEKPKMPFPDFEAMLTNATYNTLFEENVLPRDDSKFLPMSTKLQSFAQENNYEATAQLTQILFNSAVFRGIGASQIYKDLAREQLKDALGKTSLDVTKAYYGVILSRELLEITRTRFENASEHLSTIRSMRTQGLISDFDEMQAEIQVANIRPVIMQMENVLLSAENGLKLLLNIPQNTDIFIDGKMQYDASVLNSDAELIAEALEGNLTINTLRIKNQLDKEFAAINRGEYWPTLAAFGNYSFAGSAEGSDFQNYKSSMVGLSFSINLFQGGRTARKVEQANIVARQTDTQIGMLKDATALSVTSKLNELRRVQNLIELMQRNIELAKRAYQIATHRYAEGLGSELEVKDADVALSQAKTNYTNSVYEYIIAKAELENLAGKINPKYINDVLEN